MAGSCHVRLHIAKSLTGFKLCSSTPNKPKQHELGVQKDATCDIEQCWELLANNVASVCTRLKLKVILHRTIRNDDF